MLKNAGLPSRAVSGPPYSPAVPPRSTPAPGRRFELQRREWRAFRQDRLALVGLGIMAFLVLVAVYALTQPIPWNALQECVASNNQPVTFQESGLPAASAWSVTVQSIEPPISSETISSQSDDLTFSLPSGPDYRFSVGNLTGYAASPSSGEFGVAGAPVSVRIAFSTGSSPPSITIGASATHPNFSLPGCSVCTYPAGTPAPGPNCYQTPRNVPGVIAPTLSLTPPGLGPLPMGSLSLQPDVPYFYNLYNSMLRGADWTLFIAFSAAAGAAAIGLALGTVAGFFGGPVDGIVTTLADIFRSIPPIVFAWLILAVVPVAIYDLGAPATLGSQVGVVILAFVVPFWPSFALAVRRRVRELMRLNYVEYSRAIGATRRRVFLRHILPSCARPLAFESFSVVGFIPQYIGAAIFLGLPIWPGASGPFFPEWGTMAALGTSDILGQFLIGCESANCVIPWWQMFFPVAALGLLTIGSLFIADGLLRKPESPVRSQTERD
jgi:peptide/nickel transport system permease protein